MQPSLRNVVLHPGIVCVGALAVQGALLLLLWSAGSEEAVWTTGLGPCSD